MKFRKIILAICIILACSFAVSCSDGIDKDSSKMIAAAFYTCVKDGRYVDAAALMHPEKADPDDLRDYFTKIENETGADFSDGINVPNYTNFKYSYYTSDYDGSYYMISGSAFVGDTEFKVTVEFVKNSGGEGIYGIEFARK